MEEDTQRLPRGSGWLNSSSTGTSLRWCGTMCASRASSGTCSHAGTGFAHALIGARSVCPLLYQHGTIIFMGFSNTCFGSQARELPGIHPA
jgi:hypothetical protein